MAFQISSPSFEHNARIPARFTCEGEDISPELRWSGAPEGTRSKNGQLQPGKGGAAYLADRARVPILPIGQAGTETVLASWKRLRRPRVRLVIGPAYTLPTTGRAFSANHM